MPDDSQLNNDDGSLGLNQEPAEEPKNLLGKNQKLAAAGLAVFAFLIVILWFAQLKNNIYAPFNGNADSTNLADQASTDNQAAADLALKNKDTDGDGLSDYDELNIYKTSPYLADSDSDGLIDGEEVKNGTDPNCPVGRTCVSSGALETGAATSTPVSPVNNFSALLNQPAAVNSADPTNSANVGGLTANLSPEQKQVLSTIDAPSLRQLLIESGMDKAALDKIGDAELMQSYNETLNSSGQ